MEPILLLSQKAKLSAAAAGVADVHFSAAIATLSVALPSLILVLSPEKSEPFSLPLNMRARESALSFLNTAKMMLGYSDFFAWSLWLLCPV